MHEFSRKKSSKRPRSQSTQHQTKQPKLFIPLNKLSKSNSPRGIGERKTPHSPMHLSVSNSGSSSPVTPTRRWLDTNPRKNFRFGIVFDKSDRELNLLSETQREKMGLIAMDPIFSPELIRETIENAKYLSSEGRKIYEVQVQKAKRLKRHYDGASLEGEYLFVLLPRQINRSKDNQAFEISHPENERTKVPTKPFFPVLYACRNKGGPTALANHSFLSSGLPVLAAGHLYCYDGKIITVSNNSGHYKPKKSKMMKALSWFRALNGEDLIFEDHSNINNHDRNNGIKHYKFSPELEDGFELLSMEALINFIREKASSLCDIINQNRKKPLMFSPSLSSSRSFMTQSQVVDCQGAYDITSPSDSSLESESEADEFLSNVHETCSTSDLNYSEFHIVCHVEDSSDIPHNYDDIVLELEGVTHDPKEIPENQKKTFHDDSFDDYYKDYEEMRDFEDAVPEMMKARCDLDLINQFTCLGKMHRSRFRGRPHQLRNSHKPAI